MNQFPYLYVICSKNINNSSLLNETHHNLLVSPEFRAFIVAHTIGDIITGDITEPEVFVSASPSVGGLLDSLTGSIGISGISARAKPVAASVAASTASGTAVSGAAMSDSQKIGSRPLDKDALRSFISSAMPFGRYSLLWYSSS